VEDLLAEPGIAAPAEVQTRLGTLRTVDGFPDQATIEKVYDNLDFQRGVQTILTTMQGASLVAMRRGLRGLGPDNTTVALFENLMDSKTLFLTANPIVVYMWYLPDVSRVNICVPEPDVVSANPPAGGIWKSFSHGAVYRSDAAQSRLQELLDDAGLVAEIHSRITYVEGRCD